MSAPSLEDLRRQIDAIDDGLHDLLMRRADLVGSIRNAKSGQTGIGLRPGREAQVIRRLLARHAGDFPKPALVRLWREIMGAFTLLQTPMRVAVARPPEHPGGWDLARDQFGAQIPFAAYDSAQAALAEVLADPRTVAVVPAPVEDEANPWWPRLTSTDAASPRVVARLPFVPMGNQRNAGLAAYVVARIEPEQSGDDRSLVVIESPGDVSRSKIGAALARAGLPAFVGAMDREASGLHLFLLELPGFVPSGDPRLAAAAAALGEPGARAAAIGSYAVPAHA